MSDGESAVFAALSSAIAATSPAAVVARLKYEGAKVSGYVVSHTSSMSPHQVFSHQISADLEVLIELVPLHREGRVDNVIEGYMASMIIVMMIIIIIIIKIIIVITYLVEKKIIFI